MIYIKQNTIQETLKQACFAAMYGAASIALASMTLEHFQTQFCVSANDLSVQVPVRQFCLPSPESIKAFTKTNSFIKAHLTPLLSSTFLDFSALAAGILSLYCAREALKRAKAVL